MADELITQDELARRLGVSTHTVARWRRRGLIPSRRLGTRLLRFDYHEVQAALERREKEIENGPVAQ